MSQTELSNRSHHWKLNSTVKMSCLNAFPISEHAALRSNTQNQWNGFQTFWIRYLCHFYFAFGSSLKCTPTASSFSSSFFFFENQSLYFSCSALFLYLLRAFSLHIWVLTYISPCWPWNPPFFHPLSRPVTQQRLAASANDIELLAKKLKNPLLSSDLTDWWQYCNWNRKFTPPFFTYFTPLFCILTFSVCLSHTLQFSMLNKAVPVNCAQPSRR